MKTRNFKIFHKELIQEDILGFLKVCPRVCSTQFSEPMADYLAVISHLGRFFYFIIPVK